MYSTVNIVFFILVGHFSLSQCVVYVDTRLGTIKGTTMLSRDGNKFDAFLNVPYAKPPVGELRFQNPEPPEPWNGTLDATKYGKKCIQPWLGTIVGSEDCLHMNIYTPRTKKSENTTKFPIWVFIFGGKKLFGEPAPYKYGPQYIMDKPVILITVSYRLGPFGFLSTEDDSISGNFGLKDEAAALKWIQHHIGAFGGDPSNVTISGGSSGAIDVNFLLYSPLSNGLFHKAISQSGLALNSDAIQKPGEARKLSWKLGNLVGCNTSTLRTSQELAKCLKTIPATQLEKATFKLTHDYILPFMLFGPVLENKSNKGSFLVEDPCLSIRRPSSIPWMIGGIKDEGSQRVLTLFSKSSIIDHFERNYLTLLPQYFRYSTFDRAAEVTEVIKARYIGEQKFNESFYEIASIYGFGNFHLGTIETVSRYRGPVYLYLYDYDNKYAYLKTYLELLATRTKHKLGAVHGEELISLYYNPLLYPPVLDGNDRIVSDQVVNLWYNFVAYGNPNGRTDHQLWKPSSPNGLEYLHINNLTLTMKQNYFLGEEYRFWKQIGSPTLCRTLSNL
ncbi:juvenile hormone esterase-like [Planococcus citri]|uniref:juvenile hormone esterase-like n=1 Tax=Planococcus citri TaxID=170843 RepID=UPI0031F9E4D6